MNALPSPLTSSHPAPRQGQEILDQVHALAPSIREASDEIEKTGRLTNEILHALKQADVFGMAIPKSMGGPEADPMTQLEIVEALAVADGSVGWVAMIGSDGGYYAAHLSEESADEIYADPNAVTASTLAPRGQARREEGGYRVSGKWSFGSAGLHAEWFVGGCLVVDDAGPVKGPSGHPIVRMMFFPRKDCLVHDNWRTTGLAGSGSNDWSVDEVFVPESRSFSLFEPSRFSEPLYAFPWFVVANAPGVSLGIARAAIDTLCELAAKKKVMPGGKRLQDDLLLQTAVGQAEAELGAARAYIYTATAAIFETVCAGNEPSLDQRAAYRLAGINAFRASKSVVCRMYEAGGGTALYASSLLDRQWRDISTITQHAFANERVYGEGGRAMMGLDPQSMML
ncbi:MAG: acyl-CoA dehydrogenase family protein [Myxococcota bacterium]